MSSKPSRPRPSEPLPSLSIGAPTVSSLQLIATAGFGLEAIVRRELEALGYEATITQPGRVRFAGDEQAIRKANLWLRTAERVLIEVASL